MEQGNFRIIDANFNRSREALRVLEEYARFILNDTPLSAEAKQLRHDLAAALGNFPAEALLAARDTAGDVGTGLSTAGERTRSDNTAVVHAAAKRLSEALRCLEEYSKVGSPTAAAQFKQIRYRGYQFEKKIFARVELTARLAAVRVYVLITESLCQQGLMETARELLEGGADCLQLREKEKPDHELLPLARQLAQLCHQAGALFIMNDRPDLAVLAGADGVHLGQKDMSVADARRILRPGMIVGRSTHNLQEFTTSLVEEPDYLAIGSIYPSETKPQVERAGTSLITEARRLTDRPLFAIGGITAENAADVIAAGATGIAVCQAVLAAPNPGWAVKTLKNVS